MTDEEYLLNFMKEIALEQKYPTDNDNIKITPISSGGANYTSKLYLVTITGKGKDDLKLFAKVAIINDMVRDQWELNPYDNEQLVYTDLFKVYRHLEEKHHVPESHRLRFPKYYGVDMTHMKEILVLEDLTSRGFDSADRFVSVDWEYAAAAVTELAKFHALSISFQHCYPSQYNQILKKLPSGMFKDNELFQILFGGSVKSALGAVHETNKEKLEKYLESCSMDMYTSLCNALKQEVLVHTDFRPSNMLHRVKEDGTIEVIPVDYQTIQRGSPVIDLLYFIFTATDGPFRAKYYQRLLDHYHSELSAALSRLGLKADDTYTKEDFEFDMKEKLHFGLFVSVMLLPLIVVPEDQAPQMEGLKDLESFAGAITSSTDLYAERINAVVDNYVEWGVL